MQPTTRFRGILTLSIASFILIGWPDDTLAQRKGVPALIPDPAVPMVTLPTKFTSHRDNSNRRIGDEGFVNLANLQGPGCVRHIWLLPGQDTRLVIHVDDADEPQIDMPLKAFFAVMHNLDPYFVDCAAYSVLPNPAPGIPGTPGYNLYLPIPFEKSCRIAVVGPKGQRAVAMVDWHEYKDAAHLTPYRLHASHRLATPAPVRGDFLEMANIAGEGFIAGVAAGYIQRNHSDMVFHTGGMTLLIDGETNPHVIRGHNVEDDFGFTWGFNDRQTPWLGCPWHINRGRLDQDGVFYRFFGPDPIMFQSSLIFRTGSRGDDMETVVYYYRIPATTAPQIHSPTHWQLVGLFDQANDWNQFHKSEFVEALPPGDWPKELQDNERTLTVQDQPSERGWLDLQHVFFERHHGATPLTVLNHAAYVRTTIQSDRERQTTLRLAIDDWAIVWLNGQKLSTLNHETGLRIAEIPITLRKGSNELLIKTNNTEKPANNRHWALHVAVE